MAARYQMGVAVSKLCYCDHCGFDTSRQVVECEGEFWYLCPVCYSVEPFAELSRTAN